MKCFITVRDEVWCHITGLTPDHVDKLWQELGVFVDGYFFMPAYKLGRWDGKIRFFERTGKTYLRLLPMILDKLDTWDYDIELNDKRPYLANPVVEHLKVLQKDPAGIALEVIGEDLFGPIEVKGQPFKLRPYQVQCVKLAAEFGSGFIIAGTGAGKTSITAGISHVYGEMGYKVITIVPSDDLVSQTYEWYDELGMDVGMYSGSSKDLDHTHVVATWQALQYNPAVLKMFQALIWDEAHGVKAQVACKLLNEDAAHIGFKFGVTGTMPKPEADKMTLKSAIGEVLISISAKWLIDNGYLAEPEIQEVEIHETYITEEFPDYAAEKSFLSKSTARMEKIADLIISQCAQHGNTFVLVNSVPFGKKLASLIKGAVFLYGESGKDIRKEHYAMFEERDDLIVIANSQIASTGISIDRIFCLMFIDAGKSFIKAIQSVGRGLRLGRGKRTIFVVDVHSRLNWAKKHWKERVKHYKEAEYTILPKLTLKVKTA